MPRIRAVEVQGFRSFCRKQEMAFDGNLAVLWGPNSQGKTSLCEAIEFLLTGTTVRRELTAGSQDEFAGALRNVHLEESEEVYVQATIEASDSNRYVVRRVLLRDFEKRSPCDSRLVIDSKVATQDDLRALGIVFSQPPMQAPILLQHTLSYLFSAKPGDRSAYFKALLEIADLDDPRREMQDAMKGFQSSVYPRQSQLEGLKAIPSVLAILKTHFQNMPDEETVRTGLGQAASALLHAGGAATAGNTGAPMDQLRRTMEERQRSAFPVNNLQFPSMPAKLFLAADTRAADGLRASDSALEKEVERFGALYRELLRVHSPEATAHPVDCPACGTVSALTSERLKTIRHRLQDTDKYHSAVLQARSWLAQTRRNIESDMAGLRGIRLLPSLKDRRKRGFGTCELIGLIGPTYKSGVAVWVNALRCLGTERRRSLVAGVNLLASLPEEAMLAEGNFDTFRTLAADYLQCRQRLKAAIEKGEAAVAALRDAVTKVVSHKTSTVGWQDVLDLYDDASRLSSHLRLRHAYEALSKEHERALKDFDDARESILGSKFSGLSDEMKRWWEFLRPESLAAFESVGMRAKATRTVDFKVALYADETQKNKTVRDAIAVFSGSQLHCLGVAAFLARSVRDGSGFLVLDDPVLSSDHEHRSGFVNCVIEELVKANLQVILVTQEQRLRDDAGIRYDHLKPDLFRIEMNAPTEGTTVTKTSDGIADKLARIKTLLNGSDEATRKEAAGELRDAAERFCKEVLVRHYGPPKTLTDLDGQVLAGLIELMDKEKLFKAPDHKGKLALLKRWTNPGNHDAPVPSTSELKSNASRLTSLSRR